MEKLGTCVWAILLPPVAPFAYGHFLLFIVTCVMCATLWLWPLASVIAVLVVLFSSEELG